MVQVAFCDQTFINTTIFLVRTRPLASHRSENDVLGRRQRQVCIPGGLREFGVDLDEVDGADEAGGVAVLQEGHGLSKRQSTPHWNHNDSETVFEQL